MKPKKKNNSFSGLLLLTHSNPLCHAGGLFLLHTQHCHTYLRLTVFTLSTLVLPSMLLGSFSMLCIQHLQYNRCRYR